MNVSSMVTNYYLIVKISGIQFGIDANLVQEIVKLPGVSPLEEVPTYIRGLVNVRGKVIPVMDINLRLGRRSSVYKLSDALLILHDDKHGLGIICNEVLEITELPAADVEPINSFNSDETKPRLIHAVARTDDGLVLLLDPIQLFHFTPIETLDQEIVDKALDNSNVELLTHDLSIPILHNTFFSGMSEGEKQEFYNRSQKLKQPLISDELTNSIPLAIIKLENELLAVELNATEGFANLAKLTPIPCCPAHIMGSMNLRGDNLTVVDIRGLLNIPHSKESPFDDVMIIKCDDYSLAVPIDEVVDVLHLRAGAINKMPITTNPGNRQYLKGMAEYAEQMLAVVDILKLLSRPELIVYEEV